LAKVRRDLAEMDAANIVTRLIDAKLYQPKKK
jgi:hypothetical protein